MGPGRSRLTDTLLSRMGAARSLLVQAPVTLLFPEAFLDAFYRAGNHQAKGRPALTLSFDVDYRADVEALPELLSLLRPYPFKASFAIIGRWVEEYPDLHRLILDEGHEVMNHSYSHPNSEELNPHRRFNELSPGEQSEEIERCHDVCTRLLGVDLKGFRTPHFGNLHTDALYPILRRLGYTFCSSQVAVRSPSFGQPYQVDGIWEFPVTTCPRHPFAVFDTWHCFRPQGGRHKDPAEFRNLFNWLVDAGIEYGAYINLYFDPRHAVSLDTLRPCLDCIAAHQRVMSVGTYAEMVDGLQQLGDDGPQRTRLP